MDITDHQDLGSIRATQALTTTKVSFPSKAVRQKELFDLFKSLDKWNIKSHLEHFVTFNNRFYKSPTGEASFKWLLSIVNQTIIDSGADEHGVTVKPFAHAWNQSSIIGTIPGKSTSTVAIGAHQDSINHAEPMEGRAPGADDDGSGTMTILEVMRVLLSSPAILAGKAEHTIEFHWYSAEEGGLLGSQDIWRAYERKWKDVRAMLQQDMTGFISLTKGEPVFGLMMDIMDEPLMNFLKVVIDTVSFTDDVIDGLRKEADCDSTRH
jgi:leucyl aminopeptidase